MKTRRGIYTPTTEPPKPLGREERRGEEN